MEDVDRLADIIELGELKRRRDEEERLAKLLRDLKIQDALPALQEELRAYEAAGIYTVENPFLALKGVNIRYARWPWILRVGVRMVPVSIWAGLWAVGVWPNNDWIATAGVVACLIVLVLGFLESYFNHRNYDGRAPDDYNAYAKNKYLNHRAWFSVRREEPAPANAIRYEVERELSRARHTAYKLREELES